MRKNIKPLIFIHRGCDPSTGSGQGNWRSNSFAGIDYVELDVRKTADDVLVVSHNRSLKNSVRRVLVDKNTYRQLYEKTGQHLPKLGEIVEELRGKVGFNLDIKYPDVVVTLAKFVRRRRLEQDLIIDSPRNEELKELKERLPRAQFAYSFNYKDHRGLDGYKIVNRIKYFAYFAFYPFWTQLIKLMAQRTAFIPGASIYYKMANSGVLDFFHRRQIPVYVWPVNREKDMQKMVELGVDGIKTSKPELLKKIFGK